MYMVVPRNDRSLRLNKVMMTFIYKRHITFLKSWMTSKSVFKSLILPNKTLIPNPVWCRDLQLGYQEIKVTKLLQETIQEINVQKVERLVILPHRKLLLNKLIILIKI